MRPHPKDMLLPSQDIDDLELLTQAARAAGALALDHFAGQPRQWTKPDATSVTEADIAVDAFLRERLLAARPAYGWLSEEHPDDGSRLRTGRRFIVDPIDGTRAFIDRGDEWVVSIAVAEGPAAVVGVLYNPVRDELWSARAGGGASRNGVSLAVSRPADAAGARVVASRKALRQTGMSGPGFMPVQVFMKSLANRLAHVAAGTVDGALATSGSADWDIAAALVLVEEAGGRVTDASGAPVRLNGETLRHPPLVAAGEPLHASILSAVGLSPASLQGEPR